MGRDKEKASTTTKDNNHSSSCCTVSGVEQSLNMNDSGSGSGSAASAAAAATTTTTPDGALPGQQSTTRIHNSSTSTSTSTSTSSLTGISVQYLTTHLVTEVEAAAGVSCSSTIRDIQDSCIKPKGKDAFCPRDQNYGVSYVDCLQQGGNDHHVGPAHFYVILSEDTTLDQLTSALMDVCVCQSKEPKQTYVWIYALCINLHRIPNLLLLEEHEIMEEQKKQEAAQNENENENKNNTSSVVVMKQIQECQDRLKDIRNVLVLIAPHEDPLLLKRTWPIYEVYLAVQLGLNIRVICPPTDKMNVEQYILGGYENANRLYEKLGATKVQHTNTTLDRDRDTIFQQITKEDGGPGFPIFNNKVNIVFRTWFRSLVQEFDDLQEKYANLDNTYTLTQHYIQYFEQSSLMFLQHDEQEAALEMMRRAMTIEQVLDQPVAPEEIELANPTFRLTEYNKTLPHKRLPEQCATYHTISNALARQKDLPGALQTAAKDMVIQEAVFGIEHASTATLYARLGDLLQKQEENANGAIVAYRRALDVQSKLLDEHHPATATSHINLGLLYQKTSKFQQAISHYAKGQALLNAASATMRDKRWLFQAYETHEQQLKEARKINAAFKVFQLSQVVQDAVIGKDGNDPLVGTIKAATEAITGKQLMKAGDLDGALLKYRKALELYVHALDTDIDGRIALLYNNIGAILQEKRDLDGAMEALQNALYIYDSMDKAKFHENTKEERATIHSNIGFMLKEQGKTREALEAMQKSLWFRKKLFGEDHAQTANTIFMIASILEEQEDYPEAAEEYKKAYKIYKETLGKEHQRTKLVRRHIHIAKKKQKAVEEGREEEDLDEEEEPPEKRKCWDPILECLREFLS